MWAPTYTLSPPAHLSSSPSPTDTASRSSALKASAFLGFMLPGLRRRDEQRLAGC